MKRKRNELCQVTVVDTLKVLAFHHRVINAKIHLQATSEIKWDTFLQVINLQFSTQQASNH